MIQDGLALGSLDVAHVNVAVGGVLERDTHRGVSEAQVIDEVGLQVGVKQQRLAREVRDGRSTALKEQRIDLISVDGALEGRVETAKVLLCEFLLGHIPA